MSKHRKNDPAEELKPGEYKGPDEFSARKEDTDAPAEGQGSFGTGNLGGTSDYMTGNTPQTAGFSAVSSQDRAEYQADITEESEGFINEGGMNQDAMGKSGTGSGAWGTGTEWEGANQPGSQQDVKKQVSRAAKDAAGVAASQAQETLGRVAEEAKGQASGVAEQVKHETTGLLRNQKDMAAQRLNAVAHSLRRTGDVLAEEEDPTIGRYAAGLAEQVERFSAYLESRDLGDLMNEAQAMARRQPELFVAGSLALGFLLGRFLKSSEPRREPEPYQRAARYYRESMQGSGSQGAYPGTYRGSYPGSGQGSVPASTAERQSDEWQPHVTKQSEQY
jgi:hypothetical protein